LDSERHFTWSDYRLLGPPAIAFGDYTVHGFGLEKTVGNFTEEVRNIVAAGEPVRWKIVEFWGAGKSTFVYNLCHSVNQVFFFQDALEASPESPWEHVFAFYTPYPTRKNALFDYAVQAGLPRPWKPGEPLEAVRRDRENLLSKAIRKIAFILLRHMISDASSQREIIHLGLAAASLVTELGDLTQTRTEHLMRELDKGTIEATVWFDLEKSFRYCLTDLIDRMPEEESRKMRVIEEYLPDMVYPEGHELQVRALRNLLGSPGVGLRSFDLFRELCKVCKICILLVIDEVEDWTAVVKRKLDFELLSMIAQKDISIILVFRTEVIQRLKRSPVALKRYLAISEKLDEIEIPKPRRHEVIELSKGVLATVRPDAAMSLFPLSEEFAFSLAKTSVRGDMFNPRVFIRALCDILEKSLFWSRPTPELTEEFAGVEQVRTAVSEAIVKEVSRERETAEYDPKVVMKFAAAASIAHRLLTGGLIRTREELEREKAECATNLGTATPSDMEILASVESDRAREELRRILEGLK